MDQKDIIAEALNNAISASDYNAMLQSYAAEGKTSGDQKEDLIYYTKLNAQRSRRIDKTTTLDEKIVDQMQSLPKHMAFDHRDLVRRCRQQCSGHRQAG